MARLKKQCNERQSLSAYKAVIFLMLVCMGPVFAADVFSNRDPRVDQDLRTTASPEFVDLILSGANIISAGSINFKPSGDNDDYLSLTTVGDIPRATIIGGNEFSLHSDTTFTVFSLKDVSGEGIRLDWLDGFHTGQLVSDGVLRLRVAGNLLLEPNGDESDYFKFTTVADVPTIAAVGGDVIAIDDSLSLPGFASNWTNAGNTIADLGSVTTADINGGTVDNITSLTVANNVDIGNFTLTANGLTIDGTFTDGTMSLSGGNITSMGNITGSDVDISAGTGSVTSTGFGKFGTFEVEGTATTLVVFDQNTTEGDFVNYEGTVGKELGASIIANSEVPSATAAWFVKKRLNGSVVYDLLYILSEGH